MTVSNILSFLEEIKQNNNREWFAQNKERYIQAKEDFEKLCISLTDKISHFDSDILPVDAKECIFRIYRDTRFSHDKTPYKQHFAAFIAANGGRKSIRGGYYFHIEPGKCFVSIGVWCPPPDLLKALRQSVYDNIDELKEIIDNEAFKNYFPSFFDEDKLKTAPKGFPKDFADIELIKLKHYMVEYTLPETLVRDQNFVSKVADIMKIAQPLNAFLNYTVDELSSKR